MSSEDIERRRRLESAVEEDDWSSVIDGQTKLTEEPKAEADAPTATIIRFVVLLQLCAENAIRFVAISRNYFLNHRIKTNDVQPTSTAFGVCFPEFQSVQL